MTEVSQRDLLVTLVLCMSLVIVGVIQYSKQTSNTFLSYTKSLHKFESVRHVPTLAEIRFDYKKFLDSSDSKLEQYPAPVLNSAIIKSPFSVTQNSKIPFYIYNDTSFQWIENCTKSAENPLYPEYNRKHPRPSLESHFKKQHGNDLRFVKQLSNHPWRTYDPHRAEIFVIPTLLNFMLTVTREPVNHTPTFSITCNGRNITEMQRITTHALHKSDFFRMYPGKHIMVASTYEIPNLMGDGFSADAKLETPFKNIMRKIIIGNFEDFPKMIYRLRDKFNKDGKTLSNFVWRSRFSKCNIIVPYHNLLDPVVSVENWSYREWQNRKINFHFMGRIDKRKIGYRTRVQMYEYLKAKNVSKVWKTEKIVYANSEKNFYTKYKKIPICNFKKCLKKHHCVNCYLDNKARTYYPETIKQTKFVLMLYGDTSTSSRLYDAISVGAIPVIMSNQLMTYGLPFIQDVPWRDMLFFVDVTDDMEYVFSQLQRIKNAPKEILQERLAKLKKHAKNVLWNAEDSKVGENLLIAGKKRCLAD